MVKKTLDIRKGNTFSSTVYWEDDEVQYKAITGITLGGPTRLTVTSHGLTPGWKVAVEGVVGTTQLNAANTPPKEKDLYEVSVIDANTIGLAGNNSSRYRVYVSGGFIRFNTARSLAGFTARMSIKDKVGGTELLSLTTANGRIVLDDTFKVIELSISATDTAAITWKKGVYDLELVSGAGVVTTLLYGSVSVTDEVTT